nr:uncharacterized protein LOC126053993 [Helicoverpa armigera]
MPVKEVKNKMVSLCGSYRREKSREKKSRITGSGAADVYNSKWFGYPYFHFLKDKNESGDTRETMPNEAIPESSQTSDVERHTETENAPTKSQLPEASIEEAPPPQLQDLASEASMPSPSEPARKKKNDIIQRKRSHRKIRQISCSQKPLNACKSLRSTSPIHTLHLEDT